MSERIEIRTLTDGGQQPGEIARLVVEFVDGAERSLDLAHYDFALGEENARAVGDAIRRAADRGVRMRFAYNVDHANPIPVPPPPEPDALLISSLPVEAKAIAGVPDLMQQKYLVRDDRTVWTGSHNWTDRSLRNDEVTLRIAGARQVEAYRRAFLHVWGLTPP